MAQLTDVIFTLYYKVGEFMEINEQEYFIVDFKTHCKICKHKDKANTDTPCDECLSEPINLQSEKPTRYEKPSSRN